MRTVSVYINSTTRTVKELWGIVFAENSLTNLMTPAPKKSYVTNKTALRPGKEVANLPEHAPKTDERDVQLTFGLTAKSLPQFFTRYNSFCKELAKGFVDLSVRVAEGESFMQTTYHLLYTSCSQYSDFNGRLGKFVIKFNEPNPDNRETVTSSDIS